jgi:hypothetical protein
MQINAYDTQKCRYISFSPRIIVDQNAPIWLKSRVLLLSLFRKRENKNLNVVVRRLTCSHALGFWEKSVSSELVRRRLQNVVDRQVEEE